MVADKTKNVLTILFKWNPVYMLSRQGITYTIQMLTKVV